MIATHPDISELRARWERGEAVAVGNVLYEPLAAPQRVAWACDVLDVCRAHSNEVPPVEHVAELGRSPGRWHEARKAFGNVRALTLDQERKPTDPFYLALLHLAENTAKVIYNASAAPLPFDADAGWWVASCARAVVDCVDDPDFETEVWDALCSPVDDSLP